MSNNELIDCLDRNQKEILTRLESDKKELETRYDGLLQEQVKQNAELVALKQVDIERLERLERLELANQQGSNVPNFQCDKEMKRFTEWVVRGYENSDPGAVQTAIVRATQVQDDPKGGYFVLPQLSNQINQTIMEVNPMFELASKVTLNGTNQYIEHIDDEDETDPYENKPQKGKELSAYSDTELMKFGRLTFNTYDLDVKPKISEDALRYIPNVEGMLQERISKAFSKKIGLLGINGTGVGEAKGVLNYDNWSVLGTYERGKLETRNSGSAGSYTVEDLIKLISDLKAELHPRAIFAMNPATLADVLTKKSDQNFHFLNPLNVGENAGFRGVSIIGYPVRMFYNLDEIGVDKTPILFGDFSSYLFVQSGSLRILRDPYTVDKAVVYKTSLSLGGGLRNFEGIKKLKLSA